MEMYTGCEGPNATGPPSVAGDRAPAAHIEVDEEAPSVVEGQLTTFREGRDKQRLSVRVVAPGAVVRSTDPKKSASKLENVQATSGAGLNLVTVAVVIDEDGKEILDERGEPKFVCAILQNAPPPHWVLSKSALRLILTRLGEAEKRSATFTHKGKAHTYWGMTCSADNTSAGTGVVHVEEEEVVPEKKKRARQDEEELLQQPERGVVVVKTNAEGGKQKTTITFSVTITIE
jgi:hypothetical protein